MTTKKQQIALLGNAIGSAAGIIMAFKENKGFWGYVGFYVAFGIVGSAIGYGIGYAVTTPTQQKQEDEAQQKEAQSIIEASKQKEADSKAVFNQITTQIK